MKILTSLKKKNIFRNKKLNITFLLAFCIGLLLSINFLTTNNLHFKAKSAPSSDIATDEVIVKYRNKTAETVKERVRKKLKTSLRQKNSKINIDVVKINKGSVTDAIREYESDPAVEYAEPNYIAQTTISSDDPYLSTEQWGHFKISAADNQNQSAWDITTGNSNIKVAVLDTGIEETHPDIQGKVVASKNFTTSPTTSDLNGHGTHVAGTIGAATNNAIGVAGIGYNTTLLNGKVLKDDGQGYYSWIIDGITWAIDNDAKVINISLGGTSKSRALQDAIDYAWSKGVVTVAAAGNNNTSSSFYPARYEKSIAVAATTSDDVKASFSNYGNWVDIAAPGVSILSTTKEKTYKSFNGTSMAAPHVSGVAALVWASNICNNNSCVRSQIEKTADKIQGTGSYWSNGRLNAYKAVQNILVSTPTPSTPSPTPTPTPTPTPSSTPTPTITSVPTPTSISPPPTMILSLTPIADSEVRADKPTRNYGTSSSIDIDGSPIKIGYLKFDLSQLSGKTIKSAKLLLRINNSSSSTQNIKITTSSSWTETEITYNNRPGLGPTLATITNGKSGKWYEVDISSYVIGQEGNVISLGIDSSGSNNLGFYSRNSSSKPELIITY